MQLSIREAATLLGQSPRTVRARVHRGDLPGCKVGGCWRIDRRDLPLTDAQRRSLQDKADRLRRTVEDALPSRLARTAGSRTRSVADLEAFRLGAELLGQMKAADADLTPQQARARQLLESALLALAESVHHYDGAHKLAAAQRARTLLARSTALLLLGGPVPPPEPVAAWVANLETGILPAVGGLARWAESLTKGSRR